MLQDDATRRKSKLVQYTYRMRPLPCTSNKYIFEIYSRFNIFEGMKWRWQRIYDWMYRSNRMYRIECLQVNVAHFAANLFYYLLHVMFFWNVVFATKFLTSSPFGVYIRTPISPIPHTHISAIPNNNQKTFISEIGKKKYHKRNSWLLSCNKGYCVDQ